MLRFLFDEPERALEGRHGETVRLMEQFISQLQGKVEAGKDVDHKLRTYEIWTRGLISSLNELEQSHYATIRFKQKIKSSSVSQMQSDEYLMYQRYVYFDKNAFIRVFALLDKIGILLNDLLAMKTERIKPHFSFFTVLRNMRDRGVHRTLTGGLDEVKGLTQEPMARLRKRRNAEIHYMNSEMLDDLVQSHKGYGLEVKLENIMAQSQDLAAGVAMVTDTLYLTFQYACGYIRKR
ncbi:Cthe_2314 family HEPN domain-containing protein [Paenibacillus algorifonticola]|uniref:Cthe_2314 family HEPN domain-containing protein n=1 Tax=Paenibacillus algorifonticola TaxID=684063 RepID=UPI003D2B78F8